MLALFGFLYLAWEEVTGRAALRRDQQPTTRRGPGRADGSERAHAPPSTGSMAPLTNEAAGTQQERRGTAEL